VLALAKCSEDLFFVTGKARLSGVTRRNRAQRQFVQSVCRPALGHRFLGPALKTGFRDLMHPYLERVYVPSRLVSFRLPPASLIKPYMGLESVIVRTCIVTRDRQASSKLAVCRQHYETITDSVGTCGSTVASMLMETTHTQRTGNPGSWVRQQLAGLAASVTGNLSMCCGCRR